MLSPIFFFCEMHLNANPMDPESQARIMEEIRQSNVEQNFQTAMEHMVRQLILVKLLIN